MLIISWKYATPIPSSQASPFRHPSFPFAPLFRLRDLHSPCLLEPLIYFLANRLPLHVALYSTCPLSRHPDGAVAVYTAYLLALACFPAVSTSKGNIYSRPSNFIIALSRSHLVAGVSPGTVDNIMLLPDLVAAYTHAAATQVFVVWGCGWDPCKVNIEVTKSADRSGGGWYQLWNLPPAY